MSVRPVASQTRTPLGTGIIGALLGCRAPPRWWPDQPDPRSAPVPQPTPPRPRRRRPPLWWAWRLNGRRQHKRDKGRIGRAFGGLLLLQTFAPPPKQKARGDPVPARYRRD